MPGSRAGRDRFTLAHEIAHLLLGHGKHLKAEWRDDADNDNDNIEGIRDDGTALKRMESQANYLASCLLMPRERFKMAFYEQLQLRGVQNKGVGPLFVDRQECNLNTYYGVNGPTDDAVRCVKSRRHDPPRRHGSHQRCPKNPDCCAARGGDRSLSRARSRRCLITQLQGCIPRGGTLQIQR
ncbi:ImmA/IrrE family metallo-endopeptidase [Paracidovorax avenae]|uniref:ImmA/IrrE family metallo-endopeptidase n=1 Tax=Paracidovorax avenae TaxID=80867 RepID=UPI001F436092|nr:ImmA/IrrE family metallo-endopeptidase [Paracidovorax avenae]